LGRRGGGDERTDGKRRRDGGTADDRWAGLEGWSCGGWRRVGGVLRAARRERQNRRAEANARKKKQAGAKIELHIVLSHLTFVGHGTTTSPTSRNRTKRLARAWCSQSVSCAEERAKPDWLASPSEGAQPRGHGSIPGLTQGRRPFLGFNPICHVNV
jgi:hypothetical protein